MPAPFVPSEHIAALTDSASVVRGTDYFRRGLVLRLTWDDKDSRLVGSVQGTRSAPYRSTIAFGKRGMRTSCSCPLRSACKHVVAVLLASNAEGEKNAESVKSEWRSILSGVTQRKDAVLALGFQVEARERYDARLWAPRVFKAATPREIATEKREIRLTMRPLLRSDTSGSWVRSGVDWDSVRRLQGRYGAETVRWFSDLFSISRDSLIGGSSGEGIALDGVQSALLWPLLREGAKHGIPLLSAQKNTDLTFATSASAQVRVAPGEAGSLSLDVLVLAHGMSIPREQLHLIGRSGIYTVAVRNARLAVILAELALSEPIAALLSATDAVEVPHADRADFLTQAYPGLVRTGRLIVDRDVQLPPLPAPELILHLTYHDGDVIEYEFAWRYSGFGAFPLGMPEEDVAAVRDHATEQTMQSEAQTAWAQATELPFSPRGRFTGIEAAEFSTTTLPALREAGFVIEVSGTPKHYTELAGTPVIAVHTVESTDADWFDLGVIVTIDGKKIPFAPLFSALSQGRKKLLLVDGSYFSLHHPTLARLRELIEEASQLGEEKGSPRIGRYQIALWEDFEDLADESVAATSWRATADALRETTRVPETPVPAGVHAELRGYQKEGFDWLVFLWEHRLGGILADDMGLGKTLQLLTLLQHAAERGEKRPFLVVAPTSVLTTWEEEAARFTPGLRLAIVTESAQKRSETLAQIVAEADVIVTSYTLARLGEAEFSAVKWAALFLDEAQFVKNPATRLHRAIASFSTDAVFAVTGTPMENSLGELWALLSLTAPGLFPSARRFRQEYIGPIERGKVPETEEGGEYRTRMLARLRRRIRPLVLRRTKELVAPDLPEKQEQVLHVELSPTHRARYEVVLQRERQKVLGLLEDLDKNRFIVFRSLTVLRLLSLAPGLLDDADAGIGSRKLDELVERVGELRGEGHRILVFSQFTSFLQLAAERLDAAGIGYSYLDGSTRNRRKVIDGFRSGDAPVFLISLKAGGFGLTLTEADYVFLLDPWWNPAAEAQAIDRTHRIGQRHPVMVYRMIASDTIEEKVLALQQRKARLFSAVMDEGDLFARSLTADDIRGLFEP